ncbi:unnamed protein product [Discosporangium mesarthrocarpum]
MDPMGPGDLRFTYCACAVSSMLGDWSGVNRSTTVGYILNCFGFDGGCGLVPGGESHGGSTYCAVASLALMGELPNISEERREGLDEGFQGRPNKDSDTCHSFWVGATLSILGELSLVDIPRVRSFHLACQDTILGGFSKMPHSLPDLIHSFYSLCWLGIAEESGLEPVDCVHGVSQRTAAALGVTFGVSDP